MLSEWFLPLSVVQLFRWSCQLVDFITGWNGMLSLYSFVMSGVILGNMEANFSCLLLRHSMKEWPLRIMGYTLLHKPFCVLQVRKNNVQNMACVYCRRKEWAFRLWQGLVWVTRGDTEETDLSPPSVWLWVPRTQSSPFS